MIETILHEREIQQLLNEKKLQAQEVQSNTIQALNVDLVIIGNNGSGKENCRTKTPCSKSVKDSSLDSATKDMQTQESKVDTGKALDVGLVVTESSGTESEVQDESNRSGNDTYADDADIRPYTKKSQWMKVNSHAKIQPHKTRNSNKPVEQKSHTQKPVRQIFTGHRFSPNKSSVVPTGKIFTSCTSKADSEHTHGSSLDISKIHECKQTLDLSAGTSTIVQIKQSIDLSVEVPATDMIVMTSMTELECLFDPLFDEYFNGENQVVSKSFAVTSADASDKRQQQHDSSSSTSTP
ncbi:hypothetical protein Tco_1317756 [Tanacetum coccineum]